MVRGYLNENSEVIILYEHGVYVRLRLKFLLCSIYGILENSSDKRFKLYPLQMKIVYEIYLRFEIPK